MKTQTSWCDFDFKEKGLKDKLDKLSETLFIEDTWTRRSGGGAGVNNGIKSQIQRPDIAARCHTATAHWDDSTEQGHC